MRENALGLRRDYEQIALHGSAQRNVTPAADWFFDNYYVIERQLRLIRDDLPPGYYRQLPKLVAGPLAGYPRIAALAWEITAHTDSSFEGKLLTRFVASYQRSSVLTIGELWALASMLRVVLIENLRRCADLIVSGRQQREEADALADRLLGSPARPAESLDSVVSPWRDRPLPSALAMQLVRRLRDADISTTPASKWLDDKLRSEGLTADGLVQAEMQRQSAANVTVRNIVTTLLHLSALDWADIVESLSAVDGELRSGSDFQEMDFPTRNRYRSAVEDLAAHSELTEVEVAREALARTRTAPATAIAERDPGFYLIGDGRPAFESALDYRPALASVLRRLMLRAKIQGYLATIIALTGALVAAAALLLRGLPPLQIGLLVLFIVLPASEAAIALVNTLYTRMIGPEVLPALDLLGQIPDPLRTLVVMPVLLTSQADVEAFLEQLESHYLASARGELYFGLLADATDAQSEFVPTDAALIAAARSGTERLNARYGPGSEGPRFIFLYRGRRWNPAQGCWMAWERKRGKLEELNRLLRGARDTTFQLQEADFASLPRNVRNILVLDADTQLSPGAAERLIAKLSHPLNRPHFDTEAQRVTRGYGVLQPRVAPALPGDGRSLLQEVASSDPGIDPYAFAASDLYQDLCGEGSFTGKGIYDIDAFQSALAGRVPENAVLSHDLLEGIFARSGLASDVEVLEPAPDRYDVAAAREHRWARGDWQLLPWLLGSGPVRQTAPAARRLTTLDRWKMIDNLRRTMIPLSTVLALASGWTLGAPVDVSWLAIILLLVAIPPLIPVCLAIRDQSQHLRQPLVRRAVGQELRVALLHWALTFALLADRAARMTDAMVRTLARVWFTHRHLLDWTSAAQARRSSRLDLWSYAVRMRSGIVLALLIALLFSPFTRPDSLATPWILIWAFAPVLAWRISQPRAPRQAARLAESDAVALRLVARRTWAFFERFVTAEDNHLPPDNFQETPEPVVAHRTSPTNVGLYVLAAASAYEFGWLGLVDWIERLEATFATVARLEGYRGHFYNWYDTQTLRPLQPIYISTVDSGNFAGHLITLANALDSAVRRPLWRAERLSGVRDALALASLEKNESPLPSAFLLAATAPAARDSVVTAKLKELATLGAAVPAEAGRAEAAQADWARAAAACAVSHGRDVEMLLPATLEGVAAVPHRDGAGWRLSDASQAEGEGSAAARALIARLENLAATARRLATATDFGFLFDPERMLLSIGYRVTEAALDSGYYDLLASESRLASYLAVAKRDVPSRHWFRLGRGVVPIDDGVALLSWAGSMFEYLMPSLVMAEPRGSLLEGSNRAAVRCQQRYAGARGLPWGISESAYNQRDLHQTYQYSPFGVPTLGLKRGLADDAVVAPYATALAAMLEPAAATANLEQLRRRGALGQFGFYESLDFTAGRLAEGQRLAIVRAYMAHHQGMTIVALTNALLGAVMRTYFHAEPLVRATELLLQEKPPRWVDEPLPSAVPEELRHREPTLAASRRRRIETWRPRTPQSQLISNGRYAVIVNAAGAGASRWQGLAVTRWSEDATRDDSGQAIFLRDLESGAVWSAGFQPTGARPESYQVIFAEDRVEIARRDGSLASTLEIVVSAEHDAEARRLSITNRGLRAREIEVTSYLEIVLTTQAADRAHPVFSNLFVDTEYVPGLDGLIATRRPRAAGERPLWAAHVAVVEGEMVGSGEYETARHQFIGRGHRLSRPRALVESEPLSGTVGTVLDPIFSLRRRVRIPRGATARVTFWTAVAETRDAVLQIAENCRDSAAFGRASMLAWTHAQVRLHHLELDPEEASLFQRLATHVCYFNSTLRPPSDVLRRCDARQSALWVHGISGDLPIVVVEIDDFDQIELVRQLLRARDYWALHHLAVDLVVVNETASSYAQDLQSALEALARTSPVFGASAGNDGKGRVYILRATLISAASRAAITASARALLVSRRGSLAEQLARLESALPEPLPPVYPSADAEPTPFTPRAPEEFEYFNGIGGFSKDGKEYVVVLAPGVHAPQPWINVIAQPAFGFQVSAAGAGFSWSQNSRENPLTPWSNDPVMDPASEAIYVRDEETGELWSPTASPIRDAEGTYVARHGHGYSRFQYEARGIALELVQFVPLGATYKLSRLKIRNRGTRTRELAVCAYVEWTLGFSRPSMAPFIVTERCERTGALLARNPWNPDSGSRIAFFDLGGKQTSGTADRREFLGTQGSLEAPAALRSVLNLSMRTGAGLDPCGAWLTRLEVPAGEELEVLVVLGEAEDRERAVSTIEAARALDLDRSFAEVTQSWNDLFGAVQISTPDRSFDFMMNRWVLYQVLACRVWARAAFYQASGAFGFRDQLQDVMALGVAAPAIARAHILRAGGRQFAEGDVQHWWMPSSGRGVRTRVSDDRVWLAYCVAQYISTTGDVGILDEPLPFLTGEPLAPGAADSYFEPGVSADAASLFEHCARALDTSLELGAHGLPLIGGGDWNDGFNLVGAAGRGESVWLGWFLCATLDAFRPFAIARDGTGRADRWEAHSTLLRANLEQAGWDGDWYRRGYFDDGSPLGSAGNAECRIDSIAQSWSVLSGAANSARAAHAMAAVTDWLWRPQDGVALLFTPPFVRGDPDPGYIKAYPPGVRENGGQYTHAAVWSLMAFAQLGDGERAKQWFDLLNPVNHSRGAEDVARYQLEPYAVAADVYSAPGHVGRGGWSWYTGSAGWLYRAGLESILGFRLTGNTLSISPCIPRSWRRFDIEFRYRTTRYHIAVTNPFGVSTGVNHVELDHLTILRAPILLPLVDDGAEHTVRVVMGAPVGAS
jgi:cyclic beta-1,2-glucan synthetase